MHKQGKSRSGGDLCQTHAMRANKTHAINHNSLRKPPNGLPAAKPRVRPHCDSAARHSDLYPAAWARRER